MAEHKCVRHIKLYLSEPNTHAAGSLLLRRGRKGKRIVGILKGYMFRVGILQGNAFPSSNEEVESTECILCEERSQMSKFWNCCHLLTKILQHANESWNIPVNGAIEYTNGSPFFNSTISSAFEHVVPLKV